MNFRRTLGTMICVASLLGVSAGHVLASDGAGCVGETSFGHSKLPNMNLAMVEDPEEGTIIVDGKAFSVLQNCKGENWKFVAEEHTLYLENYDGLYIDMGKQEEAKIVLTGSNRASSNMKSPAILADGNLTIEGEGDLTLQVTACHSAIYVRNGKLTIQDTTLKAEVTGDVRDADDLIMADKSVILSHAEVTLNDEIACGGAAIGSRQLNISITNGTHLSISSKEKALATFFGKVSIDGADTSVEITSEENAVYAKEGFILEGGASFAAKTTGELTTAVYCPEGEIQVNASELKVDAVRTAMAGVEITTSGAYITEPQEGVKQEVSSLMTIVVDGEVTGSLHIVPGVAPTATPTPTPSPTPSPVPTVAEEVKQLDQPSITPRMLLGAGLILTGLAVVAVVLIMRIRGRNE